jgi:chitinase
MTTQTKPSFVGSLFTCIAISCGACGGVSNLDAGNDSAIDARSHDGEVDEDGAIVDGAPLDAPRADAIGDASAPTDAWPSDDAPDGARDGAAGSSHWIMGYYLGYGRGDLPPDEVDFASLTHIAVGPVVPQANGSLDTTFDIDATNGPMFARDVATRAHAAGRVAILMIGGAGAHDGFASAASPATRATFVSNLVSTMHAYGYDGLDLDWEPIDTADQAPFEALVRDLRAAEPRIVLTIPVMWVNANDPTVPSWYGAVAPLFDQMNLMTYGMAGAWEGWQSWHSSAVQGDGPSTPSSIDSSVRAFLAAGVPAAKLGIGVGFYGSCWSSPVTAPNQDLNGSMLAADDNVMTYAHIVASYYSASAYHYDAHADAPYLSFASPHGAENCTFVSYEDETSIAAKGRYVDAHGLGGGIIWAIHEGHIASAPAGSRDPLLRAMRAAF